MMKTTFIHASHIIAVAMILSVVTSCTNTSPTIQLTSTQPSWTHRDYRAPIDKEKQIEAGVINIVNEYRRSRGISPMTNQGILSQIARQHSQKMASQKHQVLTNIDWHHGFSGRSGFMQVKLGMRSTGENVAAQSTRINPSDFLDSWVNSPSHRENLEKHWTTTGVGVCTDAKGITWVTQLFGR
jgi:uncharacterized protein YkwD